MGDTPGSLDKILETISARPMFRSTTSVSYDRQASKPVVIFDAGAEADVPAAKG